MKLFAMIFLSIFLGRSCSSQSQKDWKEAILEYTANTRGFYQKIEIQNQMVRVSKDRSGNDKGESTKISDKDWATLTAYFETIDLENLPNLKGTTKKRFHDGAAIANLKITYKGKTYETASFDHGYPPEQIKELVDKINTFSKK